MTFHQTSDFPSHSSAVVAKRINYNNNNNDGNNDDNDNDDDIESKINRALRRIIHTLDTSNLSETDKFFHQGLTKTESERLLQMRQLNKGVLGLLSHDLNPNVKVDKACYIKSKVYHILFNNHGQKVRCKSTVKKVAAKIPIKDFYDILSTSSKLNSLSRYNEQFVIRNNEIIFRHFLKKTTDALVLKKYTLPLPNYSYVFGHPYLMLLRASWSCLQYLLDEVEKLV